MSAGGLGLQSFVRAWRAGELRLLAVALALAVAAVTAVGFFTDRIQGALERQSGELLAADRVVESRNPIPSEWRQEAKSYDLRTASFQSFRTMVLANERFQMAEVKAVDATYPLRGQLRVAPAPYAVESAAESGPQPGKVWLDVRLAQALALGVGESVRLGRSQFEVSQILTYEPDRGGVAFAVAPRLMMNLADLPATELIQNGSLVDYNLLLAGPEAALKEYAKWLKPQLEGRTKLVGGRDSRPEIDTAMNRAERFLGLAALSAVLLAGVAAATAAHRHARRHFDAVAVMRCLGATQRQVVWIYTSQLALLGVGASLVGVAVGYLAHQVLVELLAAYLVDSLPPPGMGPVLLGLATGLITLAGFALPPILALRDVAPLRVLRRELGGVDLGGVATYLSALVAITALMWWQAQDLKLTTLLWGGTAATVVVLALVATGLVYLIGRMRAGSAPWRFGLNNIRRRARASVVQMVAIGLGLMILLLLAVVRGELLGQWSDSLPPDAPNQFVINIQPDEVEPLRRFFAERDYPSPTFYPMIRGRLSAINGKELNPEDYESPRAQHMARREHNLSQLGELRGDNHIIAGKWWQEGAAGEWSVEERIAERLGIELGDELTFDVSGSPVTGTVTSLRRVDWDSFHVNFFIVAPPGQIPAESASYITSFYLPSDQRALLNELVAAFPTLTVIDVDAIMSRVRGIIERVSQAVEFIFIFTLLAGILVLVAVIQSSHDERLHEAAILRTLGASDKRVRGSLIAEFLTLGGVAGVMAAAMAALIGMVVAGQLFEVPYTPSPLLFVAGALVGAIGVGAAGLWGTRQVLTLPPLVVLRRG